MAGDHQAHELPERLGQAVQGRLGQGGVGLGPGSQGLHDVHVREGVELPDGVAGVGQAGQVVLAQQALDVAAHRAQGVVHPIVAVGALEQLAGMPPVHPQAPDELYLALQVQVELVVGRADLRVLAKADGIGGLGVAAGALPVDGDGQVVQAVGRHDAWSNPWSAGCAVFRRGENPP